MHIRYIPCTRESRPMSYIFSERNVSHKMKLVRARLIMNILELNNKCPIIGAKRITTKFGPTVLLTIRDSQPDRAQISLPKRYSAFMSDGDISIPLSRLQGHFCNIKILLVSDRGLMHICLRYYTYTPCMRPHDKVFSGSSSMKSSESLQLYRKRHMVGLIHTSKCRPSDFCPVTISDVLFTMYILCPYGNIPSLYCGNSWFILC